MRAQANPVLTGSGFRPSSSAARSARSAWVPASSSRSPAPSSGSLASYPRRADLGAQGVRDQPTARGHQGTPRPGRRHPVRQPFPGDAGGSWHEISGNLPTDFGFPIGVHAHEPDTVYVVPITSDSHHFPPEGKLRVYRSRTGGDDWEALTRGLPQEHCYVNVLRDAMAVDSLEDCGVYFGTTGGQVYASADAGDSWAPIVRDLPAVSPSRSDAVMIRVVLPAHLRTLARVGGEVELRVEGEVTQRAVLDELEARYPVLRGTIRGPTRAAAGVHPVLRVRAGPVTRVPGCTAPGRGRRRHGALPDRGGHGGWLALGRQGAGESGRAAHEGGITQ